MSLALLPPLLWLLHSLGGTRTVITARNVTACVLLCAVCTTCYVTANGRPPASEKRFHYLLKHCGTRDEIGWAIYTYYRLNKGDYEQAMELAQFMLKNKMRLDKTYHILAVLHSKAGELRESEKYYQLALSLRPRLPMWKNELGQLYMRTGQYGRALKTLKEARRIDRSLTCVAEGVGLAYIHLGHLDSAQALADTLFMDDKNSPGAHLIKMTVALNLGDEETARYHFSEYLKHGRRRSDYETISEYYGYLSN